MTIETPDGRSIQIVNEPLADGGWVATHEDITERTPRRTAHHPSCALRRADRPAKPRAVPRAAEGGTRGHRSRRTVGGALHRHRRIQERQRLARPPDRRRTAEIGRRKPQPMRQARRFRRPARRRRIRHRADRGQDPPPTSPISSTAFSMRSGTPFECLGHELTTDASIGIALAPEHGVDLDQILKNADLAMYAAKSAGRRTYRFFEPDMDAQVQARRKLELDLRQAIADEALEVYYQPCVSLADDAHHRLRSAGALAPSRTRHGLARRIHPDRGRDRPDQPARRMGADDGLRARPPHGPANPPRGQRLAGAVQERHAGAEDHRGPGGVRPAGEPARTGDHRGRADPR